MSFLRHLLMKAREGRPKSDSWSDNPSGGHEGATNEIVHLEGFRSRSATAESNRRSGTPSPANSPKLNAPRVIRVGVKAGHTGHHVAEVLPNLLLGAQEFSQDLNALTRHKVTHILNITMDVCNAFPDKFIYKRISISDRPSTPIVNYFDDAFSFIQDGRQHGCVLVHCYYGNSRSASIMIGYLMKTKGMRYKEALTYLQIIRPEVEPNDGFERQLKDYEQQVYPYR